MGSVERTVVDERVSNMLFQEYLQKRGERPDEDEEPEIVEGEETGNVELC
jgi:hypothetical protein